MSAERMKLSATISGVAGLAGGGFTLSFASLRDLAVASGITPTLAFLWPLVVDGFIIVATAAAFRLKGRGRRVTWYPWAALVMFAAVSIAGNALHAANSPARTVEVWVATVVSAVPAVALLVASHLLVLVTEHRDDAPAVVAAATTGAAERLASPTAPGAGTGAAPAAKPLERVVAAPERDTRDAGTSTPDASAPAVASDAAVNEDLARWVREQLEAGERVTGAAVAGFLGVSARTGRRRLDELQNALPHLFTAGA